MKVMIHYAEIRLFIILVPISRMIPGSAEVVNQIMIRRFQVQYLSSMNGFTSNATSTSLFRPHILPRGILLISNENPAK